MATGEEVRVRVRLDTRQAKSEMRDLSKEGARTSGKISGSIRGVVRQGLGMVGLGAGIGTGMAAIRGATQSGFGDIIGETFQPVGAWLQRALFGDLAPEARAKRATREEAIQKFGYIAGAQNWQKAGMPPSVQKFLDTRYGMLKKWEQGRQFFEENYGGIKVEDLLKKIIDAVTGEIGKGFTNLKNAIFGGGNK